MGIEFRRVVSADGTDTKSVSWTKQGQSSLNFEDMAKSHKYFVVGSWNLFSEMQRMEFDVEKSAFTTEIVIGKSGREAFQILLNSNWLASVHPKVDQASFREEGGELQGPDSHGFRLYWAIGVKTEDLVHAGDHVKIFL